MDWQDLNWRNCEEPIGDDRVQEIEESLGIVFPSDFRDCIKKCHGGSPSKQDFRVPAPTGQFGGCFAFLLSFAKESEDSIEAVLGDLDDRPDHVIPFAEDGGGDFICFDYSEVNDDGSPTVLYWHRTGLPDNQFVKLSSSFTTFLDLLT